MRPISRALRYGIDRPSNSLGRLDVATGSYTQIGLTGATIGDTGGLAFDEATGTLYGTFAADGGFYRIDPATGTATLIAVNRVDFGLAFAPQDKPGKYVLPLVFRDKVIGREPDLTGIR